MDSYFKNLITILLSVATATGLIIWAAKEIIKKFIQVDIEKQKNKLSLEHQKYTKLQTEQFDTLKIIYGNLIRTDELLRESFSLVKDGMEVSRLSMERTIKPLIAKIFETDRHFKQNSIFLSVKTCDEISKTIDALFFCLTKTSYAMIVKSEDFLDNNGKAVGIIQKDFATLSSEEKDEFLETIKKIEDVRENVLKQSIEIVNTEFRKIFGVK